MYKFINGVESNHEDSLQMITKLEEKYSITFPAVLKEYYQKFDAEKIKLVSFKVDGFECEVAKIVPIIAETMNFEQITDDDKADGFIPVTCYPLARDRGGNYFYWDSTTGKVLLIFDDDFENPFEICESVDKFFDILENTVD